MPYTAINVASARLGLHLMTLFTVSDSRREDMEVARREIGGAFRSLHAAIESAIDDLDKRIRALEEKP